MGYIKQHILHPLKMKWYDLQIVFGGAWRLFCRQQNAMAKKLQRAYYNETAYTTDTAIVFTCNGWMWHGGLADRLKGIISIYTWCRDHDRMFKINFCDPFRLQDYLVPNEVDWLPTDVVYNKNCSIPKVCMMEARTCAKNVLPQIDQKMLSWLEQNLTVENRQIHIYTNLQRSDVQFSKRFHELFRPCDRLRQAIRYHQAEIDGRYISISFRFTTLLGDFEDCAGQPLPEEERPVLIEKCVAAIAEIRAKAPAHRRVLVTADSPTFLKRVESLPDVYVVEGQVGHIDYQHSDAVNLKTFLDFFLISKAEKVYLARTGQMYRSAFAKTAALVENKPFEEYAF